MHPFQAHTLSRPEHKKVGAWVSHGVFGEASRRKGKLVVVLLLLRRDVLVVVRRMRSVNSVRNAMKTCKGSDCTCKRSSFFAARAPVRQRRAARLPKPHMSRKDILRAHLRHLSFHTKNANTQYIFQPIERTWSGLGSIRNIYPRFDVLTRWRSSTMALRTGILGLNGVEILGQA